MNDFWKNLAALLKVKTIVTMVVICVQQYGPGWKIPAGYGDDGGHHGDFVLFWEPERKE